MAASANSGSVSKVQEDVQRYVKSKHLDVLVSAIVEQVLKYRPNYLATFVLDFLLRNYAEEIKPAMSGPLVQDLMKKLYTGRSPTDYSAKSYLAQVNTDVQQELDQYLSELNVFSFFSGLVEKVLLSDAVSPHSTIVQLICEQFPEQAILALELLNPPKNTAKEALAKSIADQLNKIDAQHEALEIDSEEESDEEKDDRRGRRQAAISFSAEEGGKDPNKADSDDEKEEGQTTDSVANELHVFASSPKITERQRQRQRRSSVSSESIDPQRLKEQLAQLKFLPKSDEVMERLYALVSRSPMLRRLLREDERVLICKAFQGPIVRLRGDVLIRQGEEGNVFYMLEKGEVNVFVRRVLDDEAHVHTYTAGDTFGQLALLYNTPRAATCKAATEVMLWTLERNAFKAIIVGAALRKRETYANFLSHVPILQTMSEQERLELADALVEETFADGSVVCKEGDSGDEFFLVLEGVAQCFQRSPSGGTDGELIKSSSGSAKQSSAAASPQEKLVSTLQRGDYFGEIALLMNKPRQATVRAQGPLKVLVVDRATFTRVFGPIEDLLKRNMELYETFSHS